ncbi:MAG: exodeoxyribonuclease VII large subunit [Acidobacteriota bacterium]|nr:MAG: exodeoxyribonuclease VII large subunit [Acidobacteriota bacterium]
MKEPASKLLSSMFTDQRVLTVSELTVGIKELLEAEFFSVHVQGEISNFKNHSSGHWYFTIRDEESQVRGVFFRQWNRLLRFEPENGLEVRVRGRLTVYQPRGEYQIVVETMEPVGVGALQLAFEQQVRRYSQEGLFDEARKRELPFLPRRIAIVTSPVGAALRDMLQILERRNRSIDVLIVPVRVQGSEAAREIAEGIRLVNDYSSRDPEPVDLIITGRGGGSMEDLWAFNEEPVVRAIFESEIPVISAVGHETDFTISDFVADKRAPTPSAAAEIAAPELTELLGRIEASRVKARRALDYLLLSRRSKLRRLIDSSGFTDAAERVMALSRLERELESRSEAALRENLGRARQRFELEAGKLDMLSPLAVLGRGYAIIRDAGGHLVARAESVRPGQSLTIRFADGEVDCTAD